MAKTIPMIITNKNVLVKRKESGEFLTYDIPAAEQTSNIPFYHQFAGRIAEYQRSFKEFIREEYGKKFSKNIFAIITPDDTSPLEAIFINEFFLHSGACKAVAQMTMGQTLSKTHSRYISLSMSARNIILQYIHNNEVVVKKLYDYHQYNAGQIFEDAKRLHIDIEYAGVPLFINNFNLNMDAFFEMGQVISPKELMEKIADIDVEKV